MYSQKVFIIPPLLMLTAFIKFALTRDCLKNETGLTLNFSTKAKQNLQFWADPGITCITLY